MKRRISKKGDFICRRMKSSDKAFRFSEAVLLVLKYGAYIVRHRHINNVILVSTKKSECLRLVDFLNNRVVFAKKTKH